MLARKRSDATRKEVNAIDMEVDQSPKRLATKSSPTPLEDSKGV